MDCIYLNKIMSFTIFRCLSCNCFCGYISPIPYFMYSKFNHLNPCYRSIYLQFFSCCFFFFFFFISSTVSLNLELNITHILKQIHDTEKYPHPHPNLYLTTILWGSNYRNRSRYNTGILCGFTWRNDAVIYV